MKQKVYGMDILLKFNHVIKLIKRLNMLNKELEVLVHSQLLLLLNKPILIQLFKNAHQTFMLTAYQFKINILYSKYMLMNHIELKSQKSIGKIQNQVKYQQMVKPTLLTYLKLNHSINMVIYVKLNKKQLELLLVYLVMM